MIDLTDNASTHPSTAEPMAQIIDKRVSRRSLLGSGGVLAAAAFLAGGPGSMLRPGSAGAVQLTGKAMSPLLGFEPIPLGFGDEIVVPHGYTATAAFPWGDPIVPGGPAFRGLANSAAEQAEQFGMGHDGMYFFPIDDSEAGNRRGVLAMNHEYTLDAFFHEGGTDEWTAEKTLKSQNGHGLTVVEIELVDGSWVTVDSRYARRYTGNSPMTVSGPAAGHPLLQTGADPAGMNPLGTLNNCGNGYTPWGTYLTCEENFNGYFGSGLGAGFEPDETQQRYGITAEGFGYQWHTTDPRFDVSDERYTNEPNRFGWVVEVDPMDPDAVPVKRTGLGRIKHEGAAVTTAGDGRVACYMGDDERYDYVYKYLSYNAWSDELSWGRSPFDHGVLHVAKFLDDGSGFWMPLVHGHGPLTAANGFADQAEVLIKARLAADMLGATPMDRPEWTTIGNQGEVFFTCTNNTQRTDDEIDAANPRAENSWGHIIRLKNDHDHLSVHFYWDLFVLAGPGDGVDGSTVPSESAFGSPDGLWSDPSGRLWIETDGAQPEDANDQLLCSDPTTGEIKRFLTGVKGCEITGITMTPDQRTMFINVQHPGNGDPEASSWPSGVACELPRAATVVITKDDGGIIGS